MYRVTYVQGNGYFCGCCRKTTQYEEDFETEEQVKKWLIDFEVSKEIKECEDDDDKYIDSIVIISEDVTDKFDEEIKEEVQLCIARKRGILKQKEDELAKRKDVEKELKEKAELERLKSKYES